MYQVLVVDDEPLSRARFVRYLHTIPNVTVIADARNGVQAVELLNSSAPDAVITDIRMPNMDGIQLTEYISCHRPEIRVVLVSAYDELEYARAAMRFGVDQYLIKPIRLEMVQQMVAQLKLTRHQHELDRLYIRDLPRVLREHAFTDWFAGKSDAAFPPPGNAALLTFTPTVELPAPDDPAAELMEIAVDNIVHWAAPHATVAPVRTDGKAYRFAVVVGPFGLAHVQDGAADRITELLNGNMTLRYELFADAEALRAAIEPPPVTAQPDDASITKAKAFISAHLADPISRQDVAQAVYMDSSYFSRYFKKKTGVSFRDYLQNERIARVKILLKSGKRVNDACEQTGFRDRKYFNELFKKLTGMTPSEYRRSDDPEDASHV